MTDADTAYTRAQDIIAKAKRSSATTIDLDIEECHALRSLPPEIAELQQLKVLDLRRTQVSDIAPLAGLTALTELSLNTTQVSDITPLAGLTALTQLYLTSTQISDIAPLAGLTALTKLSLTNTQVSNIAPVAGLTALTQLYLSNTQVSDIAPLAGMTALTELYLGATQVSDIATLAGMTALTRLDLNRTQVNDIAPLAGLTALTRLDLSGTQVSDIAPLAGLTALEWLDLDSTQVSDIAPLQGLTALTHLYLNATQVTDIAPLAGLNRLLHPEASHKGVDFAGIPALRNDPQLADIEAMRDRKERTEALRAYFAERGFYDDPPQPQPPDPDLPDPFVFVSYARADGSRVQSLHDFLTAQNIPLWWDQDIPAGAAWRTDVQRHLDTARAVLTLWTAASTASKAVVEEASTAQSGGRLVHARLDDAPLPFGFAEMQYVDLRSWDGTATHPQMQKLLQVLRGYFAERELPKSQSVPDVPEKREAPLETEIIDATLRRATPSDPPLPEGPTDDRARQAWRSISDFRDGFVQSVNIGNYRPLNAAISALDRALSDDYETMNPVGVGITGQRLNLLSSDTGFVAELPEGAGSELAALAGAVSTFVNRFPAWKSYLDDADNGDEIAEAAQASLSDLKEIARTLETAPDVDEEVAQEYRDELEQVHDAPNAKEPAQALLASTRELLITMSENALMGWRLYQEDAKDQARRTKSRVTVEAKEFLKIGPTEIRKAVFWGIPAATIELFVFKGANIARLAAAHPDRLGWLASVLRFFGL